MIPAFAPPRQEPSLYPVLFDRNARFHELDPCGDVARPTILKWFEQARRNIERRAYGTVGPITRPPLATVRLELLGKARCDASYQVGGGVSAVSQTSFACTYGLFADGECVALGESVSAHSGTDGSVALPGAVRERLATIGGTRLPRRHVEHDPARLVRDAYPFNIDVRARFGDLDTARVVGNVALAGWYLDVLAELHLQVLGRPVGCALDALAPRSFCVDHLTEIGYPGVYRLGVGVVDLDETSVNYAFGLFEGAHCRGLADGVGAHTVPFGPSRLEDLADRLQSYRLRR